MADRQSLALLGDEAAALGALHAGLSAAYGYPGTPSTEIMEFLLERYERGSGPRAQWTSNEKTALEGALGVSFAGKRALVTMKHVGLNVASDPLMNGALLGIQGGLVIAVADDPGMHSSQNEQDSRHYAAFAMIPCLEPRSQQEAYDMAGEAFALSERFRVPVLLRLTTRLSHSRAAVIPGPERGENPLSKAEEREKWMLLPAHARRNYLSLIEKQAALEDWALEHPANRLETEGRDRGLAVITSGLGGNYYEENLGDLIAGRGAAPAHLHIATWPLPQGLIRELCAGAEQVIVIEEGQPFIEERLRGILRQHILIRGKLDGTVNRTGELDPETVRRALGLAPRPSLLAGGLTVEGAEVTFKALDIPRLPGRPPQLCQGCPHRDSYDAVKKAASSLDSVSITADIGCYSLGGMAPYEVPETIVCMGASIGMAKGASDAGIRHALAVIGDSTFLHSGITGLIDAVASRTPLTVIILDNSTVAMTGCQEPILPPAKLRDIVLGVGVEPAHLLELEARGQFLEENAAKLRAEAEYRGPSVVIFRRECLESLRKRKKKERTKKAERV
ncbi:MAG: indolepyruvate ferredoxin oxidoreductase [Spirochaetaceae bacterium]|jgi:indolepyruvate ferredoxin oxidoreductase alpha subunit|nr:indolepyruvate ferredoxin oxidoreductase [Spirochaetaceae bacterium]